MVGRLFLLSLCLSIIGLHATKIHDSLKYVGKRYSHFSREFEDTITAKDFFYKHMSASEVNATKWNNAHNLVNHFVEMSSTENEFFKTSFEWIESISSSDMTAEICGDEKKFNAFQYLKHMGQTASQYKKVPKDLKVMFTIMDTPKDSLQVNMMFEQTDKNGVAVTMHYDVTLKATFVRAYDDSIFSITHVAQGGSCLEHGIVGYTTIQSENEVVGYLENHPDAKLLLNLFTPRVFQYSEETKFSDLDVNHLPSAWLLGITSDAKIGVCHEGETDPVVYTTEQFRSWYQRFGQMWHAKAGDDEAITMQGLELKDGVLNVRVTMKLQIGTKEEATVHDWEFKISAKLNDDKSWSITQINVLCPSTITSLKDENFLAYRDVFGATFNLYINDRKLWYPATDFTKHFRKYGETIEFMNCFTEIKDDADLPKRFWIYDRFWNATMIGYFNMYELTAPAKEDTYIVMRMKMQPPKETPIAGDIFGSDWKFYIKWDKMDQFYYFYKAEFSCPQYVKPGDGSFRVFTRHGGIGYKP